MLQNKRFIALLLALLVIVAGYNIHYFSNRPGAAPADDAENPEGGDEGFLPEEGEEGLEAEASSETEGASEPPRPLFQSSLAPVQLVSLETLSKPLSAFSAEGMARNPFLTQRERIDYREKKPPKRIAGRSRKKRPRKTGHPISSDEIKMIYHLDEKAYVWIRGRPWQEGEFIENAQILSISTDSILLSQGNTQKTLFINRHPKTRHKGVQIHYDP